MGIATMPPNEERLTTQRMPGEASPERQIALPGAMSKSAQWGLASLLTGGTLLITSAITLVFNVLFLSQALHMRLAMAWIIAGTILALAGVVGLSVASVVFGILGWRTAFVERQPPALPLAGTLMSLVALLAWLIVGIDLVAILISVA